MAGTRTTSGPPSGSPGPRYWQQRVDYVIKASLDTVTHAVTGTEHVTYHNNSPDVLPYLWFQLDQNIEDARISRDHRLGVRRCPPTISDAARKFLLPEPFDGGDKLTRVQVVGARVRQGRRRTWWMCPM